MLTLDAARTHDLIQLREPITLTVDTSRLVASGFDLTVWNSATQYGLRVALIWRSIASALAAVYFIYLYRSFRGKVTLEGNAVRVDDTIIGTRRRRTRVGRGRGSALRG
jgi:hypothetical protein